MMAIQDISTTNLQYYFKNKSFDTRRLMYEFTKNIYDNVFWQNRFALIDGCKLVDFKRDKWTYYPLLFCQEYYNEQYIYPVILLINNLGSMFDFTRDNLENNKIKAPEYNKILKILALAKG